MRTLAFIAVAALLLAGCAGTTDSTTSASGTGLSGTTSKATTSGTGTKATTSGAPTSQGTTTTAGGANHAPHATIAASVSTGTIPFNVTFTLDGSDVDGDALNYTLDADGGETEKTGGGKEAFHATFVFEYKVAGNFTATLTVTDGKNSTVHTKAVSALAASGGAPLQVEELAWATGMSDLSYEFFFCEDGPGAGVTSDSFEMLAVTAGRPFKATITDASGGASIQEWSVVWASPDCATTVLGASASGAGEITGTVPDFATVAPYVLVYSLGGSQLAAHYEVL